MEWKNLNINKQNIELQTARAVLIKMPNNGNYKGYKFWHPAKCVRNGRNSNAVSLGYTDNFTFKLFKNGKGNNNKFEKVDEIILSTEGLEEAFETMDENIKAQKEEKIENEFETHVPKRKKVKPVAVLEELKDE